VRAGRVRGSGRRPGLLLAFVQKTGDGLSESAAAVPLSDGGDGAISSPIAGSEAARERGSEGAREGKSEGARERESERGLASQR
jgi:hypothetical protein